MQPTQKPVGELQLTPADALRHTGLYLRRHGWIQGDMFGDLSDPFPAACLQGGIKMAVCGSPELSYTWEAAWAVDRAIGVLADYLAQSFDSTLYDLTTDDLSAFATGLVAEWNDESDRTLDQVIEALNSAADRWDRQHPGGVR